MTLIQAVLLGVVQGLTEFLPVSSSGHLVLAEFLLGLELDGIAFEIFLHFGTLLAVITLYRKDLAQIVRDLFRFVRRDEAKGHEQESEIDGVRFFLFIIIATIPAGMFGLLLQDLFESAFSSPTFVCGALIFTGVVLSTTRKVQDSTFKLDTFKAVVIGFAQVAALFPGVSRSGTTITAGLLLGIGRKEAARFSFLLAIPLILGVTLMKSLEIVSNPPESMELFHYAVGSLAAYLSGLWAIKWLVGIVQQGRFDRFAYYCFTVGIIGLAIAWLR